MAASECIEGSSNKRVSGLVMPFNNIIFTRSKVK
jgi:hypothetical protein